MSKSVKGKNNYKQKVATIVCNHSHSNDFKIIQAHIKVF